MGANLGAAFVLGSVLYWLALDALVPVLVLTFSLTWAALLPGLWGPGHGVLVGVLLPLLMVLVGGFTALFSHAYYHEHAPYLATGWRLYDGLHTTHAVIWGPFHFWLIGLLAGRYRPGLRAELEDAERRRILRQERVPWRNWAGSQACLPQVVCVPLMVDDLCGVVRDAAREGQRVRVVASGFTWAGFVPTDDVLVYCERLDRVEVDLSDPQQPAVWVDCGVTNRQLNAVLKAAGLQTPWNVVLETVRVAGIVSMGTHGSGKDTCTMGDLVLAFEVVDATGARRVLSDESVGAETMAAARLGLGMFGIIVRVRLRVEPAHRVLQVDARMPIEEALERMPELVRASDSVELFWFPFTDSMWVKTFERTERARSRRASGFWLLATHFLEMAVLCSLLA
ncbi:FAD-binding protein [Sorangium sp. So ce887]|uniref:FAD-binding protein n=1 Tax=Sorangium sp. So ce887 TaxID=3133324 RepID=UPI003F63FCC3